MVSSDREMSRDRTPGPNHQHSASTDQGKIAIPMWDSSDPDRAPPPLPLNPTSRETSPVRAGAGANVAAAAEALAQRVRDNAGPSPYTVNKMEQMDRSPERSATRSPQHRRLQSLQNPNLRDFKAALENVRPLETISPRPDTPQSFYNGSPDRSPSRMETPTPTTGRDLLKDTPILRPSSRPGPRPILGETTPPSATMLAIQNMPRRDSATETPLADVSNPSIPSHRTPQNLDSLSSQMQNLTSIATILQKEMAALSRRSKDNATDLVSLKEATKSRDEDIRKSLRELVSTSRAHDIGLLGPPSIDLSRSTSAMDFAPHFLDSKPFHSPPVTKSVSLPRFPPLDESDRSTSPSPYSVQGASTMAMLEKIVREMVTKEGQERLLSTLSDLFDRSGKGSAETAKKVEELVQFIREKQTSKELVMHGGSRRAPSTDEASETAEGMLTRGRERSISKPAPDPVPVPQPQTINIVSDELRHYLQRLKDSVAQGGGITGEVKSLVRELRGEVLGMGRELGRRMDNMKQVSSVNDRSLVVVEPPNEALSLMVKESLAELKEQMEQLMQTRRRQSSGSALSRRSVDSSDVYALVKQALEQQGVEPTTGVARETPEIDYEKVVSAVNEAFDAHPFEPEVKVEYLGLDRDEILQCLKEGLEEHHTERGASNAAVISREEIFVAVQEALQTFTPPQPPSELSEVKEELTLAIKDCLEDFKQQQVPRSLTPKQPGDITRDDILDAVREGLGVFKQEGAREIDINREDLFDAVKTGLDNLGYGDEVLQSLHDIVERMRIEFKEYSAANGRDTELVLDATKDGLETLRATIESYVDRVKDDSAKHEIIASIQVGVDGLQRSIEGFAIQSARGDGVSQRSELVDYIKSEFQHLHETMAEQAHKDGRDMTKEQIIGALTAGVATLKDGLGSKDLDATTEEMLDAMKDEFEQLREAVLSGTAAQKDELMEAIQENIGSLASHGLSRDVSSGSNEDIITMIKEGFEELRSSIAAPVLHQGASFDKHEIIDSVRDAVDNIRIQLSSDRSEAAGDTIGLIREEFEQMRESMATSIVPASTDDRVVILEAIQETLNELKAKGLTTDATDSSQALATVREELEALRDSIGSAIVTGGTSQVDSDGLLAAVRAGFDDVRSQLDRAQNGSERDGRAHEASREILDTLRSGITDIRAEIQQVRAVHPSRAARDVVLADDEADARGLPTEDGTAESIKKQDLEKLEVALTRLHIKVEAIDRNIQASHTAPQPAATDFADKVALGNITAMIGELKGTVDILASRSINAENSPVSKEDTDAIETLLHNTKAKLEDHIIPSLEGLATRDHVDTVEAVVRLASESVDGLTSKLGDNIASKDDIAAVYGLVEQASASIKELQEVYASTVEDNISKSDVGTVSDLCRDIQGGIESLPSAEDLPSKADFEELHNLVTGFKKIHESFKQQYETDLEITAQAFDDRRAESSKILEQIENIKEVVGQAKDDLKSRMRRGNEDVRAIDEILQGIEDKIDEAPNAVVEVQEVLEVINREFEKAHSSSRDLRSGHDASFSALSSKQEALRTAILEELVSKLDERFSAIMLRHDEQQLAVQQASALLTTRAVAQDELLTGNKRVAEDLKLTIDTLGIAMTEIAPALKEATDKIGDDSKTVYNKVDDIHSRLDADHVDIMTAHELSRQEVAKSLNTIGVLREEVASFQPQAMETLNALLAIAGEHYEHAKRTNVSAQTSGHDAASIEESIRSGFASLPMPRIEAAPLVHSGYDDSVVRSKLDRILASVNYDDAHVRSKLDEILAAGRYDDGGKLDQLLNHADESEKHAANIAKLDVIHQQVLTTAAEVSAFVAFQTRSIEEDHESKKYEARKAAADVERHAAEKEELEAKIENLNETKTSLAADVEGMKNERDALISQKSRLAAELSSIETALRIRREELQMMDARADALERRIIEGVMDHSRALLIAKQPRAPVNMNLKRVGSNASNVTTSTTSPSIVDSAMNLALRKKATPKKATIAPRASERRILSLNQINGNSPKASSFVSSVPRNHADGLTNLKRSQSVRNPAIRKASWAGHSSIADKDKENNMQDDLSELDEEEHSANTSRSPSRAATSMTHRSSSYTGTHVSGSDRHSSYGTGTNPSEYSYTTGSYLSGSDSGRTTSYGSTIRSTVGAGTTLSIEEDDESTEDEDNGAGRDARREEVEKERSLQVQASEADPEASEAADELHDLETVSPGWVGRKKLTLRHPDGYDSGLGSDLPTATLSSIDGDAYFRNAPSHKD